MVDWKEIQAKLRQKPFEPFRVRLNDGRLFDIQFAHNNIVGSNMFYIGVPWEDDPNQKHPRAKRIEEVAIEEIVAVETLSHVSFAS